MRDRDRGMEGRKKNMGSGGVQSERQLYGMTDKTFRDRERERDRQTDRQTERRGGDPQVNKQDPAYNPGKPQHSQQWPLHF